MGVLQYKTINLADSSAGLFSTEAIEIAAAVEALTGKKENLFQFFQLSKHNLSCLKVLVSHKNSLKLFNQQWLWFIFAGVVDVVVVVVAVKGKSLCIRLKRKIMLTQLFICINVTSLLISFQKSKTTEPFRRSRQV